jgi:hypothetical protein
MDHPANKQLNCYLTTAQDKRKGASITDEEIKTSSSGWWKYPHGMTIGNLQVWHDQQ